MTQKTVQRLLLIAAIIMISLNLRPPITGVGPLIHEIRLDTGLSNTLLGLLTTLPILAFGICSIFTSSLTRRIGTEATMSLALLLLIGGIFTRVIPMHSALFLGTLLLGIGIALGNVLLPGIAKKNFPEKFGLVTGVYAAMLGLGAAIASGIAVPISEDLGLGWRWSLAVWGFLAIAALLSWLPQMKKNSPAIKRISFADSLRRLGHSPIAWHVSFFMGLQSFTFYVIITWLPEILIERGMAPSSAGWMLFWTQIVGVTTTLFLPHWAASLKNQRWPVILVLICELISLIGLMSPLQSPALTLLWVSLLGISLGSTFGLALLFIGLRSRDNQSANELSGMSQSIGYTFAAVGPALFGGLRDLTGGWMLPMIFLFIIALFKLWSGVLAGEDRIA